MIRRSAVFCILATFSVSSVALAAQDTPDEALVQVPITGRDEPFPVTFKDVAKVPKKYRRQEVNYYTTQDAGSIVVDTSSRYLYLILGGGRALRYGIGVGRQGFAWGGVATVGQKAAWPRWVPPKEMVARDAFAAKWADGMPGGPTNPLGARALYLFVDGVDTLYRIHGSHQPGSIGRAVSSGCVRLLNVDVIDLYEHVEVGTRVVVLQPKQEEPIVASQQATKKALLRQRWQRTASRQSKNQIRLFKLRQRLRERQAAPSQLVRKTNFNLP
jgi:lipoprotein-anchoring transpeptidase ErfK/SrfK